MVARSFADSQGTEVPTLAKYGHLVRQLPSPFALYECLQTPAYFTLREETVYPAVQLLRHLYQHCPHFDLESWLLGRCRSEELLAVFAEFLIPRIRILEIVVSDHCPLSPAQLKALLDRCSAPLETLRLRIQLPFVDDQQEDDQVNWPNLTELSIQFRLNAPVTFGPWLWGRCGQVERLSVWATGEENTKSIVRHMANDMPNLKSITMRGESWDQKHLISILSGSYGWREVTVEKGVINRRLSRSCRVPRGFAHCTTTRVTGLTG